jgi:osmotically-inducible protein OsmY
MITSAISSAARLSLAPARLAGRMAGSLLSGLRGDAAEDAQPAPSSGRTKTASRRRAQAQPKRAASRRRAKAQPKRAASRRRTQARPKRAARDKPLDDVTIARNVESTIFQGVEIDKGELDVNVADGVVRLRGEVRTPDLISELETRAARVSEVRRVENLLHLPKPPAPSRADAPARQSETSEEVPAPPSALRTRDFAAAGTEPGPAPAASASEGADPADGRPAGDETTEQEGPDMAELDKDQADDEQ